MVLLGTTALLQAAEPNSPDFARDIQPILQKRCFECHGPEKQKNGLRLDLKSAALQGGDSGKAIVPGNSSVSLLFQRVTTADEDEVMPPKGEKLSQHDIAMIKQWIDRGAPWPESGVSVIIPKPTHWSLQPPVRSTPPVVKESRWAQNPIDRFLMARLGRQARPELGNLCKGGLTKTTLSHQVAKSASRQVVSLWEPGSVLKISDAARMRVLLECQGSRPQLTDNTAAMPAGMTRPPKQTKQVQ